MVIFSQWSTSSKYGLAICVVTMSDEPRMMITRRMKDERNWRAHRSRHCTPKFSHSTCFGSGGTRSSSRRPRSTRRSSEAGASRHARAAAVSLKVTNTLPVHPHLWRCRSPSR